MNCTLRGSLLILKHRHPTKLRRPGLRACSLGPRGQRWGPGTFGQTSQATDRGPGRNHRGGSCQRSITASFYARYCFCSF